MCTNLIASVSVQSDHTKTTCPQLSFFNPATVWKRGVGRHWTSWPRLHRLHPMQDYNNTAWYLKHEQQSEKPFKGVMSWPKLASVVFRFWSLPWTNGLSTQLKWKLRDSPIQCTVKLSLTRVTLSLCLNHVATVARLFRSSVFHFLATLSKICEIFFSLVKKAPKLSLLVVTQECKHIQPHKK